MPVGLLPVEGVRRAVHGVDHSEGLAIEADGTIWSGGEEGQVYRYRIDSDPIEVARLPGFVLGLALDARSTAYCCCLGEQPGVYEVTAAGKVRLLSNGTAERPCRAPNHPVLLRDGTLLYTDSGEFERPSGCIFAVDHSGQTRIVDESCSAYPNGIALHPQGDWVAVVESTLPGVAMLPVGANGEPVGPRRQLCELPGTTPDGVAFDADGKMLVSCWVPDSIYLVDEGGSVELLLHDSHRQFLISPSNIAFMPGSNTVVVANVGTTFMSSFEHLRAGAGLLRPDR